MPLFSKSIQESVLKEDGIRICIMRKPDFSDGWDIWMPVLSPSLSLLKSYNRGETSWHEYILQFNRDVIVGKKDHIKLLVDMAKNNVITVLCWEPSPEQCHRRLILEEALRIEPGLEVVVR